MVKGAVNETPLKKARVVPCVAGFSVRSHRNRTDLFNVRLDNIIDDENSSQN